MMDCLLLKRGKLDLRKIERSIHGLETMSDLKKKILSLWFMTLLNTYSIYIFRFVDMRHAVQIVFLTPHLGKIIFCVPIFLLVYCVNYFKENLS